jgi:uncharacterized membrane protein
MAFLIVVVCCIVGLAIGGTVGNDATAALGFFGGIAIGLVLVRLRTLGAHLAALQKQLEELARTQRVQAPAPRTASVAAESNAEIRLPPVQATTSPPASARPSEEPPRTVEPAAFSPPPVPPTLKVPSPRPAAAQTPDPVTRLIGWAKHWLSEGNVPVKVGMLVLFAGVGALLKYASDQG